MGKKLSIALEIRIMIAIVGVDMREASGLLVIFCDLMVLTMGCLFCNNSASYILICIFYMYIAFQ